MEYSLLDYEDYEGPPSDPHRKFAALEQKARRNMNEILDNTNSGDLATELRSQYMIIMASAAQALGIEGVNPPTGGLGNSWDDYQLFSVQAKGVIARIMLTDSLVSKPHSVQLATDTKAKIESQIIVLRRMIEHSDIEPRRRARLIEKLDEFAADINRPRLNYGTAMAAMALFLSAIPAATSTLADAPSAYQTVGSILKWIGIDKEAEENERERLGAPTPRLPLRPPSPPPEPAWRPSSTFDDDIDDDVPF